MAIPRTGDYVTAGSFTNPGHVIKPTGVSMGVVYTRTSRSLALAPVKVTIYYTGANCTGTPLIEIPDALDVGDGAFAFAGGDGNLWRIKPSATYTTLTPQSERATGGGCSASTLAASSMAELEAVGAQAQNIALPIELRASP